MSENGAGAVRWDQIGSLLIDIETFSSEDLTKFTALAFYLRKAVDIGTGISLPYTVHIDQFTAVTATESETDIKSSMDDDICCRNRSRTTTSIYLLDGGLITSVNIYMRSLSRSGQIVCLITTAIDSLDLITRVA